MVEKYKIVTIIEIGCGTGNVAMRIKSNEYVGYDSNPQCIRLAEEKNNKEKLFQVADIRKFVDNRDEDDRYDYLVFSFGVLKHFGLDEWNEIFKKVCSIGKYLVFNVPISSTKQSYDDGTEFHHVWKSWIDILTAIKENGFEMIECVAHGVEPIFICKRSETII